MNTGSDREAAKRGIVTREKEDPELAETLLSAHKFQLELKREENRHARDMHTANLGTLGRFFGDGGNTPAFIALICVFAGIIIATGCYIAAGVYPDASEIWTRQAERALAFASASLAYMFGRATN